MIWLAARRSALGLSLAVSLCACSAVAPYLSGETPASPIARDATPTESAPSGVPAATASPTTAPAATATPPDSSVTAEPLEPTPAVAASPADALGLVYARGTSVLQTGYLGGETHEIATIPPYDSWAFDNGRLALALGPAVEVLDLVQGDQRSLHIATDAPITFSEVHWGPEEGTLLHVAWVDDATAPTHGRRVELRTLAPTDGRVSERSSCPTSPASPCCATSTWRVVQWPSPRGATPPPPRCGSSTCSAVRQSPSIPWRVRAPWRTPSSRRPYRPISARSSRWALWTAPPASGCTPLAATPARAGGAAPQAHAPTRWPGRPTGTSWPLCCSPTPNGRMASDDPGVWVLNAASPADL